MLPAAILAVCLTGCSTFLEENGLELSSLRLAPDQAWTEGSKPVAAPVALFTEPQTPQLPGDLELCLKRSLRVKAQPKVAAKNKQPPRAEEASPEGQGVHPAPPSADKLVTAELETKRQREVCAYALLKWHQEQRSKAIKK
jgi:hypothetical protein